MGLPGVKRIKSERVVKLDSLVDSVDWLRQEIAGVTTDVALDENRKQMELGNDPTRIVLDGRRAIDLKPNDAERLRRMDNVVFVDFKRKIQIFYTSVEVLAEAFDAAWRQLEALTPSRSGWARRTYSFYCNDLQNRGRSREFSAGQAEQVKQWILESSSDSISVSIQGPRVVYRRHVIYQGSNRPSGRGAQEYLAPRPTTGDPLVRFSGMGRRGTVTERRKTVLRGRYAGRVVAQYQLNKAIHKIVQGRMRRQYRDVYVSYRFIPNPPTGQPLDKYNRPEWRGGDYNIHIPSLAMWVKRNFRGGRGRLR